MATPQALPAAPPADIYLTFAGSIDRGAVLSFSQVLATLAQGGAKRVHLSLHSDGGLIDDGIYLYNLIRSMPYETVGYNMGLVASIAVLPYIACRERYMAPGATLMMHPVYRMSNSAIESKDAQAIQQDIRRDDSRIDAVLAAVPVPLPLRRARRVRRVVLTAPECVQAGFATHIGVWAPAQGAVMNIPWQKQ